MTDLTQPASAAEFQAAGVDAATAANLAAQHNVMAGRATNDDRIAMEVSMRNLPPPVKPTPAAPTTDIAALASLQSHTDSQMAEQLAQDLSPPKMPTDYLHPYIGDNPTEEALAEQTAISHAFHTAALPKMYVDSMRANVETARRTMANRSPGEMDAIHADSANRLKQMLGPSADADLKVLRTFMDDIGKDSVAAKYMRDNADFFQPIDLYNIIQVAKQRAAKR